MADMRKHINALRKCANEHKSDITPIGYIIVSDLCRDTANLLEALEQEPRWIPCSERLPKEYAYVICSTNAEEIFIATYLGKMNDGVDCFDDEDGMMWEGDVIAWMPLPQAYKESEDKDE